MRVAVIHYGSGNLQSVYNGFEYIGANPFFAFSPDRLDEATHVLLPGVGAFGNGMRLLREGGWIDALKTQAEKGKPLLGICLGMQMLCESSDEFGNHEGLGLVDGKIQKLDDKNGTLRIPHIGWDSVTYEKSGQMYAGIDNGSDFYFVHSYCLPDISEDKTYAKCLYGSDFIASFECGNIWGAQYHPEKSHDAGMQVLRNFTKL